MSDERLLRRVSRRDWMRHAAVAGVVGAAGAAWSPVASLSADASSADGICDIGSRRELFVDDYLVAELKGAVRRQMHRPAAREIVLQHDEPWEGTGSGYHSVFMDDGKYRMYYKAWHLDVQPGKLKTNRHPLFCCYAESDDGVSWRKPNLGLHDFEGSSNNNIVMTSGPVGALNVDAGHPAVFRDENPDAPSSGKYKAIFRSSKPNGLHPFQSPDGIHWTPMTDKPILSGLGAFDSQNLAFWDPNIGKYRAYWRIFTAGVTNDKQWRPGGIRAIRTAVSSDLIHWEPHRDLTYMDSPPEQLYTNQIKPYHRAPHILLGFPARYVDRGWSEAMKQLPESEHREMRASSVQRYGTAVTDALLMSSRDGVKFQRWNEAFLPPGPERPGTWHYGHQYIGWHVVQTNSPIPGAADELSLYATESYWTGKGSALRRYTLRLDGFASVRGAARGGELLTKPISFQGKELRLNFATSAAGSLRVEFQDSNGNAMPGFSLADCEPLFGDSVERGVRWKGGADVSSLAGKPVRLRIELRDADLFAFQFHD